MGGEGSGDNREYREYREFRDINSPNSLNSLLLSTRDSECASILRVALPRPPPKIRDD